MTIQHLPLIKSACEALLSLSFLSSLDLDTTALEVLE